MERLLDGEGMREAGVEGADNEEEEEYEEAAHDDE